MDAASRLARAFWKLHQRGYIRADDDDGDRECLHLICIAQQAIEEIRATEALLTLPDHLKATTVYSQSGNLGIPSEDSRGT